MMPLTLLANIGLTTINISNLVEVVGTIHNSAVAYIFEIKRFIMR